MLTQSSRGARSEQRGKPGPDAQNRPEGRFIRGVIATKIPYGALGEGCPFAPETPGTPLAP